MDKKVNVLYANPNFSKVIKFLVFFVVIYLLFYLIFGFFSVIIVLDFYFQYLISICFLVSLSIFFIFYVYSHSYWYDITKYYLENIPNEFNFKKGDEYVGVVIADKNLRFDKYYHIYNGGVLLLIESLRNKGVPLKIVKKADIDSFIDLVYDRKCKTLFIIGHGRRYRLGLHKKKYVHYSYLKDAIPKKRIEQLHCNHTYLIPFIHFKKEDKPSLAEILHAEEKYKTYKQRSIEEVINIGLYELIQDNSKF